jgi:hypothetical protein
LGPSEAITYQLRHFRFHRRTASASTRFQNGVARIRGASHSALS